MTTNKDVIVHQDDDGTVDFDEVPVVGIFAGELDVDQFNRVRIFISDTHDPVEEELELDVFNNGIRFRGLTEGGVTFKYELSWTQLAELAAFTVDH
ncbi:MAG: hypothetical protein EBT27_00235 [Betaproteobacteria bacterium]|nr:hypothetical protein [Betaproteobacteria bacterium]